MANKQLTVSEASEQLMKLETLHKTTEKRIKELRAHLMQVMKDTKVLTLKTEDYTITRATRQNVRVINDKLAEEELKKLGHEVITKTVIDMDYMRPLLKELEVPGVDKSETEYISIRRAK